MHLSCVATKPSISWEAGAWGSWQGQGEVVAAMQTRPPVPKGGIAVSLRTHCWLWLHSLCYLIVKGYHTIAGTNCSKRMEDTKGQAMVFALRWWQGAQTYSATYMSSNKHQNAMKLQQQEGNENFSQRAMGALRAHQAMAFEFIWPSQDWSQCPCECRMEMAAGSDPRCRVHVLLRQVLLMAWWNQGHAYKMQKWWHWNSWGLINCQDNLRVVQYNHTIYAHKLRVWICAHW